MLKRVFVVTELHRVLRIIIIDPKPYDCWNLVQEKEIALARSCCLFVPKYNPFTISTSCNLRVFKSHFYGYFALTTTLCRHWRTDDGSRPLYIFRRYCEKERRPCASTWSSF